MERVRRLALTLALLMLPAASAQAAPVVFSAGGANAAAIQATVDSFRSALGPLNPNTAGSAGSGRREINWDGVPDGASSPSLLPPDFFNVNSPRGVVFSTPGVGFLVSRTATQSNPEFDDVNFTYAATFGVFSPQRLFSPKESTITDVSFFIPGSTTPAATNGFGAVFTDVDTPGAARLQFFDKNGQSVFSAEPPTSAGSQGLSFLGAVLTEGAVVTRVRITSGKVPIMVGTNDSAANDVVVLDDFIYGEPTLGSAGGSPPPPPPPPADTDGDGRPDGSDNCAQVANPDQADGDADGAGDLCDAPTLSNLAIRRKRHGFRISCTLSEPAQLTFRVERKRGTRYRRLRGRITKAGSAGPNRFSWNGRLRGRRLRAGTYRLVAVAVDSSSARSGKLRKRFRVRPR